MTIGPILGAWHVAGCTVGRIQGRDRHRGLEGRRDVARSICCMPNRVIGVHRHALDIDDSQSISLVGEGRARCDH